MTSTTIGAFAPVTYTSTEGGEEFVLFIIGDDPYELDQNDQTIFEKLGDTEDLHNITVIEVNQQEWWDIKHGTNISKGFYINNTHQIELIKGTK